ncbi:MAG: hypothetical protein IT341_10820 [Chloroflexi bacterium]|nr:hypothetical protein [Chloroflexota bacterium]
MLDAIRFIMVGAGYLVVALGMAALVLIIAYVFHDAFRDWRNPTGEGRER